MFRQRFDLTESDIGVLAGLLDVEAGDLRSDLERRPWYANDVLRHPDVVATVLHATGPEQLAMSPLLFFAVLVNHAADELSESTWVDDWVGPGSRLPVFDVEPLLEFADAPGRLVFTARLLLGFAVPEAVPLPVDGGDLDEIVEWLDAAEPGDRVVLLRRLGDLALFHAGVFPDTNGPRPLSVSRAERLGRSAGMTDDQLGSLVDPCSTSPGLDALETLSSAWYRAAAESSPDVPVLLRDVANRITAARRFLTYVADRYLNPRPPTGELLI